MSKLAVMFLLTFFVVSEPVPGNRKYEYAIVKVDEPRQQIIINYGSTKVENFTELKSIKTGKQFYGNNDPIVDALNYMDEQGYELISAHMALSGGGSVMQYIFRRQVSK